MTDTPGAPDAIVTGRPQFVGARVARKEDPRLLTGNGAYVADMKAHGMLHMAFRRSDYPHASIVSIDAEAARAMPGVIGVYVGAEIDALTDPVHATSTMPGYQPTWIPPLAKDRVRYVGEPVVAVVAANRYQAEDAAALIDIAFKPLDAAHHPAESARDVAPKLHDETESNVLARRAFSRGEVEEAFAGAAATVGGSFRVTRKATTAIEARAVFAEPDKRSQSLTLYSTTQIPGILRDFLANGLRMPADKLRIVAPDVGGGFGAKGLFYPEEMVACVLAQQLGRPVKWVGDRMEDLMSTGQSFDEYVDAEMAVDADGAVQALKATATGDVGAYSTFPWTAAIEPVQVVSFLPGPYRIQTYAAEALAVATPKVPAGPLRGVGRPISTFVMERLIDMAARKLGIDPVEIRRRNLIGDDEFPYKAATGIVWDKAAFRETLDMACAAIDYDARRAAQAAERQKPDDGGKLTGIGISCYAELTGVGSRLSVAPGMPINTGTETATIRLETSGAVIASFGVTSQGQGIETSLAQVIAETLGVRMEDVTIQHGDTAIVSHGTGTYASRAAVLGGGAGTLAAEALREKVIRAAAHMMEAAPEDLETANGDVFIKGTDRRMSFADIARSFYSEMGSLPPELRGELGNLEETKVYDPVFGTCSSATHAAVVEIDPATCRIRVVDYRVAEDSGRIINPLIADGQAHGGVAQGIGAALFEEMVYDDTGQILTANLVDYVIPSAAEIPTIGVQHVEAEAPGTIGGFRGLGEGGTIGTLGAIANAVSDALAPLDIEISELPITPDRLFRLIHG